MAGFTIIHPKQLPTRLLTASSAERDDLRQDLDKDVEKRKLVVALHDAAGRAVTGSAKLSLKPLLMDSTEVRVAVALGGGKVVNRIDLVALINH